LRKINNYFRRE